MHARKICVCNNTKENQEKKRHEWSVYCASTKIILSWIYYYYYWTPKEHTYTFHRAKTQRDHILLFKGVTQFWLRKQRSPPTTTTTTSKTTSMQQQMCFINIPFNKKRQKGTKKNDEAVEIRCANCAMLSQRINID